MRQEKRYRLVTKGDFDGLVCAVLLKDLDMIEDIKFVHPRDVESGKMEITCNDITAGIPYVESAHIVFDNYPGAVKKVKGKRPNYICSARASSTARIIYNCFGGKKRFPHISDEMLSEADRGYSARFTTDEILYPANRELLNYLIDQRTGLEKFKKYKTSCDQFMMSLVNYCKDHTILEILSLPDVEERLETYFSSTEQCKAQILRCATVYYNLVVVDMRKEKVIYPGNRFIIYALFPECNVSLQAVSEVNNKILFIAGKSVIDRSYKANIGKIMSKYGGGGHANAGTCQVINDRAEDVLRGLIRKLKYGLFKNLFVGYFN